MTQAEKRRSASPRLVSLDGLRGWAALAVVFHHILEVAKPSLTAAGTGVGSAWWWINETPLKLLSAGPEAVVVFFVLSGLVVALPALRARDTYSWAAFLTSRVLRIHLPVAAAVAFAAALILLLPRDESRATDGSWLATTNATSVDPRTLVEEITLSRYSYDIVNTLWSLRWEMVFAVLLPVFVVIARRVHGRAAVLVGVAAAGLSVYGFATSDGTLSYLPAFLLGTLLAANLDGLRAAGATASARPGWRALWIAGVGASAGLVILHWLVRGAVPEASTGGLALLGLATTGAVGLVAFAALPTGFARALATPASRFLGRISFSLYLVHVPVLATVAFLAGDGAWPIAGAITLPVSLGLAWLFTRVVEQPAHRAARAAGARVAALSWGGGAFPLERPDHEHAAGFSRRRATPSPEATP